MEILSFCWRFFFVVGDFVFEFCLFVENSVFELLEVMHTAMK